MPIFVYGRGEDGQIGDGSRGDAGPSPLTAFARQRVRDAACGSGHTLCVTAEGAAFAWGRGDDGRTVSL